MEQKNIVYGGVLAGLSLAVSLLIHFPLIPQAPFLLYDPGDVPLLIAGFKFGPGLGLLLTGVVSLLFALITGEGGPWGVLMHFLATGSYVVLAGFLYQRHRTKNGAITSLIVAPLFMTAIMAGANLLITPLYMGVEREVVKGMLLPAIVPFNILKGVINGAITLLIYKRISNFIEKPLYERNRAATRVRS